MKKIILAFIALIAIIIVLYYTVIVVFIGGLINETKERRVVARELIGEKFVIENDTLLIVDHNGVTGRYSVHGSEETYPIEIIEKNLIK